MKLIMLFILFIYIPNAIGKNKGEIGMVYWRGFDIESLTGIPESQIENYGIKHCISKNAFMELLSPISEFNSRAYDSRDVRGSIIFDNDVYYVNRDGIVRYKNYFYSINKELFNYIINKDKNKCNLIDKNNMRSP